jgi:hypothetical protein
VADLTRQLAEPDLYDDRDAAGVVIAAHGTAKDEALELSARWVELGTQLEQLEQAEADAAADRSA